MFWRIFLVVFENYCKFEKIWKFAKYRKRRSIFYYISFCNKGTFCRTENHVLQKKNQSLTFFLIQGIFSMTKCLLNGNWNIDLFSSGTGCTCANSLWLFLELKTFELFASTISKKSMFLTIYFWVTKKS